VRIESVSQAQLHRTFLEAFADYAVDASYVTEDVLRARMTKNAVDYGLSVGAFDGERMVGFTLVGVGRWQDELAAFDAGTGVVPAHRGSGLAKRMFDNAHPRFRDRGVTRFLLEVLQVNEAAIRAYRLAGFEVTRELACFRLDVQHSPPPAVIDSALSIRSIGREILAAFEDAVDWQPSWENGFAAIERIPDELLSFGAFCGEECVGVVAYTPLLGWIMTLVVRRPYRRRGIGSALVHHLVEHLPAGVASVKLLNVDRSDKGMPAFLNRQGFEHWIDQYEMACPIG
jgi:ribosomal protein S18 acetylase RimI-like enzyme